jgi:subtilisin family serine protease
MENKSNLLVLLLIVMMGSFSLVLIFKGDFKREIQIAKEEEEQKAERKIAQKEKKEKFEIKWKPSEKVAVRRPAVPEEKAPPSIRRETIAEDIQRWDREPTVVEVTENRFGQRVIANELLLAFRSGSTQTEIETLESRYGMTLLSYNASLGIARFHVTGGASQSQRIEALKEQISKENPNVKYTENNFAGKLSLLPNDVIHISDKNAIDAWFFKNDGKGKFNFHRETTATAGIDVGNSRFDTALFSPPNPECATVAVVDSSFNRLTHPDFDQNRFHPASAVLAPAITGTQTLGGFNLLDHLSQGQKDDLKAKNASFNTTLDEFFTLQKNNAPVDQQRAKNQELNAKGLPIMIIHGDLTHGIATSSLIGATSNNGIGTAGLCPSGQTMVIRVASLNPDESNSINSFFVINGITHAANNGAKVINISLVFDALSNPESCTGADGITRQVLSPCSLYDAVLNATLKGAVVVAAAGNDGQDVANVIIGGNTFARAPATLSVLRGVISVGAINPKGEKTGFSNFNPKFIQLAAPGNVIKVPTQLTQPAGNPELDAMFSAAHVPHKLAGMIKPDGTFNEDLKKYSIHEFVDGTSSAAPIVSAVAAMVYAKIQNRPEFQNAPPSDIAATVKELLTRNARKIPGLETHFTTGGIVDAVNALNPDDFENRFQVALAGIPPFEQGAPIAPAGEEGGGVIGQLFGEGGGGCGFIDTSGPGNMPPWNTLPMAVIWMRPRPLWLRRRFVLGRIRTR